MDELDEYVVHPIGVVRSTVRVPADAPNQAFEGAPDALLEIDPAFVDALHRVQPGDELILLTWCISPTALSYRPTRREIRTSR
jgi:tRNA (Thr-GGU) A37 N-methylase